MIMRKKHKKMLWRIAAAALLLVTAMLIPMEGGARILMFLVPYLVIGYDILRKAALGILHGQVFDENFLMAIASLGAFLLGDCVEGTAVMLFYQIGELFQSCAVEKSRKNISDLMDIAPDYANLEKEKGKTETVDPEEVPVGSIIVIKPGEKIPLDGIVSEGCAVVNTSALTGESVPRDVAPGDEVISGCINMSGLLRVRTTKEFGDSTVSKILELVESSGMKKSKSENFITRFAKYYTPAVCAGAAVLAILPPLIGLAAAGEANWHQWVIRALTFLVISCPCALVISIPLSFFGGIGGASAKGILIKGSVYLENLAKAKYFVFDKTGTMTKGQFDVVEVCPSGVTEEALLEYGAYAEMYSGHPISKCIKAAYGKPLQGELVSENRENGGFGVETLYRGHQVAAGNEKLMQRLNIERTVLPEESGKKPGTYVHVAVDGVYWGYILVADTLKPGARAAVKALRDQGAKKITILTGDGKEAALAAGQELTADEVKYGLLPEDKVAQVEEMLKHKLPKEQLVFVGDGINDAPVLMRADIGIAMGALGSDAAIEAADVVLMNDDPEKISLAMKISRKTLRIVYQNIAFALAVKGICLIFGAVGIVGMWAAIFADVGVMVIAVLNAMRALINSPSSEEKSEAPAAA